MRWQGNMAYRLASGFALLPVACQVVFAAVRQGDNFRTSSKPTIEYASFRPNHQISHLRAASDSRIVQIPTGRRLAAFSHPCSRLAKMIADQNNTVLRHHHQPRDSCVKPRPRLMHRRTGERLHHHLAADLSGQRPRFFVVRRAELLRRLVGHFGDVVHEFKVVSVQVLAA